MEIMDKTTLRIILGVAGVLLLLAIYLWDRWKRHRKRSGQGDFSASPDDFELEEIDTISINPVEEGAAPDLEALETERVLEERQSPSATAASLEDETASQETATAVTRDKAEDLPEVIQISIVAPKGQVFSGPDLVKAFSDLGLKFGDMEIFHLHQGNQILFSAASMVKPGTFPIDQMERFQTPGLTLFMQPPLVPEPLQTFERMIGLCHTLAQRLGGSELDERRHPLTAVKLALWRRKLRGSG